MILTSFRGCWGISFAVHFNVKKIPQETLDRKGPPFTSASASELGTFRNDHKLIFYLPFSPPL